jgi:hypothetical protein
MVFFRQFTQIEEILRLNRTNKDLFLNQGKVLDNNIVLKISKTDVNL